jgi:hypothetical protein
MLDGFMPGAINIPLGPLTISIERTSKLRPAGLSKVILSGRQPSSATTGFK